MVLVMSSLTSTIYVITPSFVTAKGRIIYFKNIKQMSTIMILYYMGWAPSICPPLSFLKELKGIGPRRRYLAISYIYYITITVAIVYISS